MTFLALKVTGCDSSNLPSTFVKPDKLRVHSFLCKVKSGQNGDFVFPCVQPGQYAVVPMYEAAGVTFDVAPKIVSVVVGRTAHKIKVNLVK